MVRKRKSIPIDVRMIVLHEAGYACANPICRRVITLDLHHVVYVSEAGTGTPENLLALCPYCHALHHKGEIPTASIRAWKLFLLALNEAFDRKAVDMLLALDSLKTVLRLSGDGVLGLSSLIARGLVEIRDYAHQIGF